MVFLGGVGFSFWAAYFTDRLRRWWALIPAGVLSTLAGMTFLADRYGNFETGGVFFLGLALTFLLVAFLAGMRWAYWPALALGVLGILLTSSLTDFVNYILAAALIGLGGYFLLGYFLKH